MNTQESFELDKLARQHGRDTLERLTVRDEVLARAERMEEMSNVKASPSVDARRQHDNPQAVVAQRVSQSFRSNEQSFPVAPPAPVAEYVAPVPEPAVIEAVQAPRAAAEQPSFFGSLSDEATGAQAREQEAQQIIDAIHAETMAEKQAAITGNPLFNPTLQPQWGAREDYDLAA